MGKRITYTIILLAVVNFGFATDYYVDKDSIGGPCSDSNVGDETSEPWCTLNQADNTAIAGDVVHIRKGTYYETINPTSSGNPGSPITFRSYNNETVILDGSDEITNWIQDEENRYHADITFTPNAPFNSAGFGCDNNDGGLVLQNGAKFNYCMESGITEVNSEGKYYMDDNGGCSVAQPCQLYVYARDLGSGNDPNDYEMRVGRRRKGIDLDGGEDYITIEGLEVRRYQDNTLHSIGATNLVVRNSKFYGTYITGIYITGGSHNALIEDCEFWDDGHAGMEIANSDNNIIRRNLFKRVDYGDGYGTNAAHISYNIAPNTFDNTTIKNNVFWETGNDYLGGFLVRIAGDDNRVLHNTFFVNGSFTGLAVVDGADSVVKNNIIYDLQSGMGAVSYFPDAVSDGGHVIEYNIFHSYSENQFYWDGSPIASLSEFEAASGQTNNMDDDPLFVDLYARDFSLRSDSPAIDSGVDVGLNNDFELNNRPMDGDDNGTAGFDMGAYEYNGEYIPPEIICGDGSCYGEDCTTCSDDCGECCGQTGCQANLGENCTTCPADCGECAEDCVHDAEKQPCDGCVDATELFAYVNEWKSGPVEITDLMEAIGIWKSC